MRHAQRDLPNAKLGATADDGLQRRDQGFGPLEAEPLGANIFAVQEAFDALGPRQAAQDIAAAVLGESRAILVTLDPRLDPRFLLGILNVHELVADSPAIGLAEHRDDVMDRRPLQPEDVVDEYRAVRVGRIQTVRGWVEFGVVAGRLELQGVEGGVEVAAHAVRADHHECGQRGLNRLQRRLAFLERRRRSVVAVAIVWVGGRPGCAARRGPHRLEVIAKIGKESAPAFVDRVWVAQVARVQTLDEGGVAAKQE